MTLYEQINEQFNFELQSGYIYLDMAAKLKEQGMEGFAHFMMKQAHEEYEHAMKLYNFLFDIDEKVEYLDIKKPNVEFKSFTEIFKEALAHEKEVTARIHALYKRATEEEDYRAVELLGWFVNEQVEEEDNFRTIVEKFERIHENWSGLYIYDHELGSRE